jgi:predicted DNA-binding protein (MmcQ/YjbR family)
MPLTFADLDAYFLTKPGTAATYPFDEKTRVYKVLDKMYGLIPEDAEDLRVNLKCDPDDALALREQYEAIIPGYHMNKRHWNTLIIDGSLPEVLVFELIDHSYDLVVRKMPQAKQKKLAALGKGHLDNR